MIAFSNNVSKEIKSMTFEEMESWILSEVVPSILKNGGYIYGQEYLGQQDKDVLIEKIGQLEEAVSKYKIYPTEKTVPAFKIQEQEIVDEDELVTTL